MSIDSKLIVALRDKTGMGMSDCKNALIASNGNIEDAEMILRKKGMDRAALRVERATGQGITQVRKNDNKIVMIEVQCEQEPTINNQRFIDLIDFIFDNAFSDDYKREVVDSKIHEVIGVLGENIVLKNMTIDSYDNCQIVGIYNHFNKKVSAYCVLNINSCESIDVIQQAANDVCVHIVAMRPIALNHNEISSTLVIKEREVFEEEVNKKPEAIREKIMEGKLSKFYAEKCLVDQAFVKDVSGKTSIQQYIDNVSKNKAMIVYMKRIELGI